MAHSQQQMIANVVDAATQATQSATQAAPAAPADGKGALVDIQV